MRLSRPTFWILSHERSWIVTIPCPITPTILDVQSAGEQHFAILYGIFLSFPIMIQISDCVSVLFAFFSFFSVSSSVTLCPS